MSKVAIFIKKHYPFLIIGLTIIFVFRKFFFKGLLPIPSDIITGVYYPWLNQKWGTITGVPVKNPLPSDIPSLVYPWRLQVRQALQQGLLPLWNDRIFSGMPLLANFQSAAFSPSTFLFLWLKNNELAWSLGVVFQPLFQFLAMYVFLKKITLKKISALFGGLAFAFNGFSAVWLEYNVHGWTLIWIPLMLYSIELVLEKKLAGKILLPLCIAGSIYSGYPQLSLYSFLIVAIYTLIKLLYQQLNLCQFFAVILLSLYGILLSSPLLLPGYESAKLSIRAVDTVAISPSTRFLPLSYLTNLFAPDIRGNPATGNYTGIDFYDNFASNVGVVVIGLALLGLLSVFRKPSPIKIFSTTLVVLGLILATLNPLAVYIADLNVFGIKSIAARAVVISIFGLIVLASQSLNSLSLKAPKSQKILYPLLSIVLIFLFIKAPNRVYQRNLILPLLVSTTAAIFSAPFSIWPKLNYRYLKIVLLLLCLVELIRFNDKYLSFSPKNYLFPPTPIISKMKEINQSFPVKIEFADVIPENMWTPYGLHSAVGYDATAPLKYSRLLGAVGNRDLNHPQGRVGKIGLFSKTTDLIGINYTLALARKNGIPDSNGETSEEFSRSKYSVIGSEGPLKLVKINSSAPMLGFYSKVRGYHSDQEFINSLSDHNYNPQTELLIKNPPVDTALHDPNSTVKVIHNKPGDVMVKVNSTSGGYVSLKQNYYPGWEVKVDNTGEKLLESDYAFMAVKVEKGKHSVNFIYRPKMFYYGIWLAVTSALIGLGLVVSNMLRRYD